MSFPSIHSFLLKEWERCNFLDQNPPVGDFEVSEVEHHVYFSSCVYVCDISVAHTDDDVISFDVVTTHHRHSDETQLHISLYIFSVFEVCLVSKGCNVVLIC